MAPVESGVTWLLSRITPGASPDWSPEWFLQEKNDVAKSREKQQMLKRFIGTYLGKQR
jgi:hypothetical protein